MTRDRSPAAGGPPPGWSRATFVDELCKRLVTVDRWAVLGWMVDGAARPHGITPGDGFAWPVATGLPELRPLAEAFDRVLVRSDGFTVELLCIQDRLARPERRVGVGLAELQAAGAAWFAHTDPRAGPPPPVVVRVWEVGAPEDHAHLEELRASPGHGRVGVTAAAFGPESELVWVNAPPLGRWLQRSAIRRALRAARAGEVPTAPSEIGQAARRPLVTYGLLAVVGVVYGLEVTLGDWSAFLTPSGASLLALGGLRRDLVLEVGQWYRLASAAFLHASPVHLLFNGLALYFGGTLLERLVGRRWLLAVFGLSALGGSAASMLLNPPGTLSVGASGAILGLFGAALAVSFRIPYGSARAWAQSAVLRVLVPSLLPLFLFPQGPRIDFWAHLGGALVGLAVGLLLLARWPRDQPRPRLGGLATVLAAGCTLVLAGGLGAALAERPAIARLQALHAALAPDEALRDLPADAAARATALSALQARYPRDPRVLALRASDAGDPREAEELLRRALAELELLAAFPGGRLEATLRAQLARRLLARGAEEEAREAIRPSCAVLRADPSAPLDPEFVRGACGG